MIERIAAVAYHDSGLCGVCLVKCDKNAIDKKYSAGLRRRRRWIREDLDVNSCEQVGYLKELIAQPAGMQYGFPKRRFLISMKKIWAARVLSTTQLS